MAGFLVDWLNLLLRWGHMTLGIAWIGASFHFVWLDFSFRKRERMNPGVYGTSWMVHGGGFYHVEKYLVAPATLPGDLHWFKWEAYLTWASGMFLLAVQYYWNAQTYLVDASTPVPGWARVAVILLIVAVAAMFVWRIFARNHPAPLYIFFFLVCIGALVQLTGNYAAFSAYLASGTPALTSAEAILFSLVTLAGGWFVYNGLCRSSIGRSPGLLVACVFVLVVGAAYLFTHIFSGRGALIHVGAFMGTIMAANVFMVIIPNQTIMVGQLMRGEVPDGEFGRIGKQRSLHNNYLTLPVLLMMISNHYSFLTGNGQAWMVVALVLVLGALIRHVINRGDAGEPFEQHAWVLPVAAIALFGALYVSYPRETPVAVNGPVSDEQVLAITGTHCIACHAAKPANTAFASPPKGVVLTTLDGIRQHGEQIKQFAVIGRAMPLGNTTHITDLERAELGAWIDAHK